MSTEEESALIFSRMDPKHIEEFKVAFDMFDGNGDGFISTEELGTVMRSLGLDPSVEELSQMMEEANFADHEGMPLQKINFMQFCCFMEIKLKKTDLVEEQRKAFRVFDQDGDGYISHGELMAVLWQLGQIVTDEEVAEMIREADRDGNGLIDFAEFVLMLNGGAFHLSR